MMKLSAIFAAALLCAGLGAGAASATDIPMDTIVLGGLNKVGGRVNTFGGKVGAPMVYGTLEIVARTCVTHPPEETPENAAFLEIYQLGEGANAAQEKKKLFSGWMFGSSPALSALDHPVYDVWVLRCESSAASKSR